MRSHAKAATAGSTKRQAWSLGRFFRGAGAGRGTSLDAEGSGVPSRSRLALALLAALALCGLVGLTASPASAAVATEFVKAFGPDGTEGTDFVGIQSVAIDRQSGVVYVLEYPEVFPGTYILHKFEANGTPLDWGGTAPYIEGNEINIPSSGFTPEVAIDPTSHVVYVTEGDNLRAFEQDGEAAEFTAGPGAGSDEIGGFENLQGIAVGPNGAIYVTDYTYPNPTGTVSVFAATGEPLTDFEVSGQLGKLAVGPEGSVYVSNSGSFSSKVDEFEPSETPVTAATTFAAGKTFKQGSNFSVRGIDVDQATGELYILEVSLTGWIAKYDSDGAFVGYFGKTGKEGAGQEGRFPIFSNGLAVVPGGEEFQFYVGSGNGPFDVNPNRKKVEIYGEVINPGPPSVVSTSAGDVAAGTATLRAEINPNTFATAYRFEYGLGDCETSACTSVPLADVPIGSGHRPVKVSQDIAGLQAGTTYHYRVVAENSEGITEGPDHTLTTQVSGLGFELTDRRAWEMVSPPEKHGGSVVVTVRSIHAAEDGSAITFPSFASIDTDPEGGRPIEASLNLARRGASSWSSKDIELPQQKVTGLNFDLEYLPFSADLSKALVQSRDRALLSPQASEPTPYLRENTDPPTFIPLVTGKEGFANVPPGTVFGASTNFGSNVQVEGTNPSLTDIVLHSDVPLTAGSTGDLYLWSDGQLAPIGEGVLGAGEFSTRSAVSEDGSRVFFSTTSAGALVGLYLHDGAGEENVRLDVVQPGGADGTASPFFQGASADGTVVFFTDSRDLTADSSPEGRDLYRCEIPADDPAGGCATLTNLSPASGASAMVKGLAPAFSRDGSRIYFVAEGVLDTRPNEEGDVAAPGEPNLYLAEEGQGTRFIATLSADEDTAWGSGNAIGYEDRISPAGSPSGRYLAFMSKRRLTAYDNREATNDEPTEQAFRYDAESEELICVSCNPTGARPVAQRIKLHTERLPPKVDRLNFWVGGLMGAILPQPNTEVAGGQSPSRPRTVLDNGRVFFHSSDSLVAADSNGEWDVYQFEPTGVGDCTSSSAGAAVSRSQGGCVSLLSSGTGSEEAALLDVSASGDDVFFVTPARLSVTDEDNSYDVYDARVDGVPARLEPITECLGEACQPAAQAPNDPTPASAGFKGQGNVKETPRKRCAKSKRAVRQNGKSRCVPRKANKHKRTGTSGRAGR